MPKAAELTDVEKGAVIGLREAGWTFIAIGKHLGRSATGVGNVWEARKGRKKAKRPGRPRKGSARTQRQIILEAKKTGGSSSGVKASLGINESARTVRRVLKRTPQMGFVKRQRTPMLKPHHKLARRNWAQAMIRARTDLDRVIFSDEKKFNLDGPDGMQYYWHDLRTEKETFYSRQNGGGSVMIWGGFSSKGTTDIAFLSGRQSPLDYHETLTSHLLPFGEAIHDGSYVFQQDNANIHSSNSTKSFLKDLDATVLVWPALSPDLNPIENVWGMLVRDVYCGGKPYITVEELKIAIRRAWGRLKLQKLQKLLDSMPDRVGAVLEGNGKKTKY
ncbi:hypothetical protein PI124_g2657 [Phytophthora idaei]|nr:hypothetical protein PI125_g8146 [Phytophthora idaei]KAG3158245.1 hypothetical protein PI126_g7941 [Phytophthora idaei]KAG3252749.1 hypothetical protein PI124_g2657 [Phytophthora idaei]